MKKKKTKKQPTPTGEQEKKEEKFINTWNKHAQQRNSVMSNSRGGWNVGLYSILAKNNMFAEKWQDERKVF